MKVFNNDLLVRIKKMYHLYWVGYHNRSKFYHDEKREVHHAKYRILQQDDEKFRR